MYRATASAHTVAVSTHETRAGASPNIVQYCMHFASFAIANEKNTDTYTHAEWVSYSLPLFAAASLNYGKIFRTTSWIDYHIIIIEYQKLVLIPTRWMFPIIKHIFFPTFKLRSLDARAPLPYI